MDVAETYKPSTLADWRQWLTQNHNKKTEIGVLCDDRTTTPTISYLDSVEEAICIGWIDGIQKRINKNEKAQRFSPRKKNSNWTELNRERARTLIKENQMTEASRLCLPDLDENFVVPEYILDRIRKSPEALAKFKQFPDLCISVRVGYIDEMRNKPVELETRLSDFSSNWCFQIVRYWCVAFPARYRIT